MYTGYTQRYPPESTNGNILNHTDKLVNEVNIAIIESATCGEAYAADSYLLKYLHKIKPSENFEALVRTL